MAQGTSGQAQGNKVEQESILGSEEEEIYGGTKIDSEAEAEASEAAVREALQVGAPLQTADMTVPDTIYTVDMWRVQPGQNAAFVAAWHDLVRRFRQLPQQPAGRRVLVQSITDPDLYYSIEPWQSLADIEAIRPDEQVQAALATLRRYCTESTAGAYRTVAADVRSRVSGSGMTGAFAGPFTRLLCQQSAIGWVGTAGKPRER